MTALTDLATLFSGQLQIFVLVLARIVSMIGLLPVFGSMALPTPAKAGLSVVLTIVIFPTLPHISWVMPTGVPAFFLLVIREVLLGMITGYLLALSFQMLESAGSLIDSAAGFNMIELFDPMTGAQAALFGQFLSICASVTFVIGGGHLQLLRVLADSFRLAPLGLVSLDPSRLVPQLSQTLVACFITSLQLAGPVLMALLLLTIVMAVLSRVMPSMNVWTLSMPLQIVVACLLTSATLPWILEGFKAWHEHLVNTSLVLLSRMH